MSMDNTKTVIFDFDGTLANTLDLVARIYNENAQNFGSNKIDLKDLPHYRRLGYKKAMKEVGIRWTVLPKIVLFISREMKKHMDEVKPYPQIVNVLKKLQNDGVTIGVLTSNNAALVQDFFDAHDFPHFDFVVSEKTLFGKEKALKRILKRYDLKKENVLYVGDEPRDITSCNKAGIKVIGVTWGVGGKEALEITKPDFQVNTADELYSTVQNYSW
jgi:HAD superfamily hydrolase (TIGR01509 family)